jgi:hypothetical protein
LDPLKQAARGSCGQLKHEKQAGWHCHVTKSMKNPASIFSRKPSAARATRFLHSFMKQKSEAWGTRIFDCVRVDDAEGWGSRRYEEKAPRFCDRGAFCWRRPPCGERLGVND